MVSNLIALSIRNRFLILTTTLFLIFASIWAVRNTPVDALPDLSPPQVIVHIEWSGQTPEIVEEQGTYPLVSKFMSIADIETVRGFSTYGNALIYIIFKEGTDLYWGRSRVLEQLSTVTSELPSSMNVSLGPDASGVAWVYEYALKSKTKNLAELRALQDYYYKFALLGVDGVSEVASVGGFVPDYQVVVDNDVLMQHGLGISDIARVIKSNNNDTGGRILLQNGYEWMVSAKGYLKDLDTIRSLVVKTDAGVPLTIGDIARIEVTSSARRGVADLNGEGEVVGGIVMLRYGADVYKSIQKIKQKMSELKVDGVDVVTTYDRSSLIEKAVDNLKITLFEESLIVIVIIGLFLFHFRSSLIVLIILPLTIGFAFFFMKMLGVGSNIMSLGGIAIAIGAMVDASIVMIENAHKELYKVQQSRGKVSNSDRAEIILKSSQKVGRPIFFALTLVVVSFLPIFALSGQEGLLFSPLAFTKTFAMGVGAILSVTLVPVLLILFLKDEIPAETKNPVNRFFIWAYKPFLKIALKLRYIVLALSLASLGYVYPLYKSLNWEFMPMLNEQTFMYMPVTPYGIGIDLTKEITQKTDKILASFPEVETVFGKGGRATTATDPAPLSMIETIITFKDQNEWREGMTYKKLMSEMEEALQVPGLINSWTYPIRGRIDMLLSGVRTPLGIKLYSKNAQTLEKYATLIEQRLRVSELTQSVFADKASAGYYLDINIDEESLARYNITKDMVLKYVSGAIGGMKLGTLYKGVERYPITLRMEQNQRQNIENIKNIHVKTPKGFIPLDTLAKVSYRESSSVIKSEMASPVTYVYITPKEGVTPTKYKGEASKLLKDLSLPAGSYIEWEGQSEYLQSAMEKIVWIVPVVLLVIVVLIYMALRDALTTLMVFFTIPFSFLGGLLYIDYLNYSMSVAVIVGFLALLGIAAQTAIIMTIYLQESVESSKAKYEEKFNEEHLREAIYEGAVQRVRPKLMTLFSTIAGLLPIMLSDGVGSEVMQRIAAPMMGGVVSSAVLSLLVIPVMYEIYIKRKMINS